MICVRSLASQVMFVCIRVCVDVRACELAPVCLCWCVRVRVGMRVCVCMCVYIYLSVCFEFVFECFSVHVNVYV